MSIGTGSCVDVAHSDLIGKVVTVAAQDMGANKEIKYPRVKLHRDQVCPKLLFLRVKHNSQIKLRISQTRQL